MVLDAEGIGERGVASLVSSGVGRHHIDSEEKTLQRIGSISLVPCMLKYGSRICRLVKAECRCGLLGAF